MRTCAYARAARHDIAVPFFITTSLFSPSDDARHYYAVVKTYSPDSVVTSRTVSDDDARYYIMIIIITNTHSVRTGTDWDIKFSAGKYYEGGVRSVKNIYSYKLK